MFNLFNLLFKKVDKVAEVRNRTYFDKNGKFIVINVDGQFTKLYI